MRTSWTAAIAATLCLWTISAEKTLEEKLGNNIDALRLVRVLPLPAVPYNEKILCWVNTFDANHGRARSIKATWGKRCDKIVFMSNVEDPSIPTVRVVAPATHLDLWQKHRAILRILWREYGDTYDWIFKCDDDTYVIMENLRHYLASFAHVSEPMLLGHRMTLQWWELQRAFEWNYTPDLKTNMKPAHYDAFSTTKSATQPHGGLYYTPGGGGYAFNAAYFKTLVHHLDDPICLPGEIVPDDWAISFCMRFVGVTPHDTRDANQRERFHQYSPARIFHEVHDPDAYDHVVYQSIYFENNWFSDHYGIGWQNGTNCCAPDTISFHYIKPPFMELVEEFYYPTTAAAARLKGALRKP
ncbi:Aste57867_8949 [Aphanomyces stellatus]|uniref:N-acetylgalactosaminide beta-1,3-galactosyltransferase n=1 Tax=Aphanomyces stellatus TaxID=120398 RepID=A0A485KLQ9_9STRA|nr:hypothetical protein As57867_008914 [Aphanomyces stellatus]VFT85833.1 Aste57867_8949 [Aphanomyces stellatus]